MLLCVDIGNSNIKFGTFDGNNLISKFAIPTPREPTFDELRSAIGGRMPRPIKHAIVCSVVPDVDKSLSQVLMDEVGVAPLFVNNDFDFGLTINYRPRSSIGTDRLVNAFAAEQKYGVPCLICSFGTALTMDIVDKNHALLGGVIAPGMATMARALHLNTALLPDVKIEKPDHIIGNSTVLAIQSGIFYGQVAMAEGLISRMKKEVDGGIKVVATGGFASLIAENTDIIDLVDENLTLDGLQLIHQRISGG